MTPRTLTRVPTCCVCRVIKAGPGTRLAPSEGLTNGGEHAPWGEQNASPTQAFTRTSPSSHETAIDGTSVGRSLLSPGNKSSPLCPKEALLSTALGIRGGQRDRLPMPSMRKVPSLSAPIPNQGVCCYLIVFPHLEKGGSECRFLAAALRCKYYACTLSVCIPLMLGREVSTSMSLISRL